MVAASSISAADQRTIQRILKVNHAGEYGAIRIYRAQLSAARRWYPELVAFLSETLGHEVNHCALFAAAMPDRHARPCRIMSLWGRGGYILGMMTACMGRQGIWICTSAVEEAVHKHLLEQLRFLDGKDAELVALIESIKEEELHHLHHADAHVTANNFASKLLRRSIGSVTEILIGLSTWGDSVRMACEIDPARQG